MAEVDVGLNIEHVKYITPFNSQTTRGFRISGNTDFVKLMRKMGIQDKFSYYLASAPQFEVTSSFNKAFDFDPKKLKLAYAIGSTLNGPPKNFESLSAFGFRVWDSSEPLSVTLELKFFKGMWGMDSARDEVFNPIALLCQTILPTEEAGGILVSPSPNYFVGMQQMIQAFAAIGTELMLGSLNTIGKLGSFAKDFAESGKSLAVDAINAGTNILMSYASARSRSRGTYNLVFGNPNSPSMVFYNMIAEQASPQFSLEVDAEGFPIHGTLRLTYKSMFSANVTSYPMRFRPEPPTSSVSAGPDLAPTAQV